MSEGSDQWNIHGALVMRKAHRRPEKPQKFVNGAREGPKTSPESIGVGRESYGSLSPLVPLRYLPLACFLFVLPLWFVSLFSLSYFFPFIFLAVFLSFFFSLSLSSLPPIRLPSLVSLLSSGFSLLPVYNPSLPLPLLLSFLLSLFPPVSSSSFSLPLLHILATRENDWWYDSKCKR